MAANGGFKFDKVSTDLEIEFVRLMGQRAETKAKLAILNLEVAELTRQYAKHNGMSREESALVLLRVLKISASDGPNFWG